MRAIKKKSLQMSTRAYYRNFTFTDDENAKGRVLKKRTSTHCICQDGALLCAPEWEKILKPNGTPLHCNMSNISGFGMLRLQNDDLGDTYHDLPYVTTTTGGFYLFVEELNAFFTAAINQGKIFPFVAIGKNEKKVVLCTEGQLLFINPDGSQEVIISEGVLPAGAIFKHRLFAAMKGATLKYSEAESFGDFDETKGAHEIRFPNMGGDIVALKVYDDALYVFFENGLMRLEVRGDVSDFYAEKLDYAGGTIYPTTVCVGEDGLYFLSSSGIQRLKGKRVERLDLTIDTPSAPSGKESCSVYNGQPIFQYSKENGMNVVILVNRDRKSVTPLREIMIVSPGPDGSVLLMDKYRGIWKWVDDGNFFVEGNFTAYETDFGFTGRKTVRKLRFEGKGELKVVVQSGKRRWARLLTFVNGFAEAELSERGESFVFIFNLKRKSKLFKMHVEFETVK